MPRMTPQEAGRRGGKVGGRSRSAAKLAACKRNGFQKAEPAPDQPVVFSCPQMQPPKSTLLTVPLKQEQK
jgi:hypothetical protein